VDATHAHHAYAQGKAQGSVLVATVRGVVAERGILGFYQGLSASLLRQGTYSTIRFATYDYIKEQMERSNAGGTHHSIVRASERARYLAWRLVTDRGFRPSESIGAG